MPNYNRMQMCGVQKRMAKLIILDYQAPNQFGRLEESAKLEKYPTELENVRDIVLSLESLFLLVYGAKKIE